MEKYLNSKTDKISRYAHFTPEQKWAEVNKLRKMAWDLKCASVRASHPDWSESQVNSRVREIFLHATT